MLAGAASKATGIPERGTRPERLVQPASADPGQAQVGPERQRGPSKLSLETTCSPVGKLSRWL